MRQSHDIPNRSHLLSLNSFLFLCTHFFLFLSAFLCLSPRISFLCLISIQISQPCFSSLPHICFLKPSSLRLSLSCNHSCQSENWMLACSPPISISFFLASLFSLFEILPQFPHVLVPLISYIAFSSFQIMTFLYIFPIWGFLSFTVFVSVAPWIYLSHTASVQGGFAGCDNWLSS